MSKKEEPLEGGGCLYEEREAGVSGEEQALGIRGGTGDCGAA